MSPAHPSGRFLLLVVGMICEIPAFAIDLKLLPYRVDGGEIQFRTSAPKVLAKLPIDRADINIETAATPNHTLYADLDSIEFAEKGGYFRYKLYVEPQAGVPGELTVFTAKGIPVGSFQPQMGNVEFELNGQLAKETITLPVFSSNEPKYLATRTWIEPVEVELPGDRPIPIYLENLLGLPVRVVSIRQPGSGDLWRSVTLKQPDRTQFESFRLGPGAKTEDLLFLDLKPGPRAILKALFWRRHDKEHEKIQASLVCAIPWENLPQQSLTILVPVRFIPWPPLLFLAVVFGTLFGSAIPVLLGRRKQSRWFRAFLLSLFVAVVAEVIAMVLVQHDSQLRLLGIEMDPFQLLSAGLIGIMMGLMGFKSVDILQGFFDGEGAP